MHAPQSFRVIGRATDLLSVDRRGSDRACGILKSDTPP